MWGKRITTILASAATLVIAATAGPAHARGGQGDPLLGDLNRDGLVDRVTFTGSVPTGQCPVRVELGRSGGGYQPARTYAFPIPGGFCPDMGVIVDLGGDGTVEIVAAWFNGRPPGVDIDLIVLRDFTPVDGFNGILQPSFIELADFNGDGRQDVYEWTDQGEGLVSFLNTADGRLVPGPVRFTGFCTSDPDFELADFHRNGGRGLAIAYFDICGSGATGVAVVGWNGIRVDLEHDPLGEVFWRQDVLDANGDHIPDVRTDNENTGEVTHFIGLGDGRFVESPRAIFDRPTVSRSQPTRIHVLANDFVTSQATVTIASQPKYGTVRLNPDRTITYTPRLPSDGGDRFTYRLDQDGKHQTTAVSMRFTV